MHGPTHICRSAVRSPPVWQLTFTPLLMIRLVPFFSHYVEQQTRGFDVSHAWGEEISQMLTARWTWSWDFWPEYWRERLDFYSSLGSSHS